MKESLSIKPTLDKKEKIHILEVYKKHSINVAGRVLEMIRKDIKKLEGESENE